MTDHVLEAKTRLEKGRKTDTLRADGFVPAVVYGVGTDPQNLAVDRNQFVKMYKTAGESSIVELQVDGKDALHVLIQDYQVDPLRNEFTHVDFRSIDMNKQIETEVTLVFTGESSAVKGLGGTLLLPRETVAIRCLPSKLLRSIEVDVSALATFDDVIHVSDLQVPEGVEILEDGTFTVALVQAPRTEAEMEALDEAIDEDVASVEGVEKKEGEEAEEGAVDEGRGTEESEKK
jgi:large subunit ribosomal protein L25